MPVRYQTAQTKSLPQISILAFLVASVLLSSAMAFGQQEYVSRFNTYIGYTFLDSPHVSLFENGLHFQAGVNPKTWLALGFDYSFSEGNLSLTPSLLTPTLQQELAEEIGIVFPGYPLSSLSVSTHSATQTFAAGPQYEFRHYSKVTLFVRPSIGAIYERATPHPVGTIPTLIVAQLAPTGYQTDWTPFYGFGGGADLNFSKHLALRVQADLVYDHLFNDLLKDGRLTTRFSIGPCFNFGKNIAKK